MSPLSYFASTAFGARPSSWQPPSVVGHRWLRVFMVPEIEACNALPDARARHRTEFQLDVIVPCWV